MEAASQGQTLLVKAMLDAESQGLAGKRCANSVTGKLIISYVKRSVGWLVGWFEGCWLV